MYSERALVKNWSRRLIRMNRNDDGAKGIEKNNKTFRFLSFFAMHRYSMSYLRVEVVQPEKPPVRLVNYDFSWV